MPCDENDGRPRNSAPASFAAVLTHTVRIINDVSFEVRNLAETGGGTNGDRDSNIVPPCLSATALPNVLEELVSLRNTYLTERILMSKADVSDAFRNVRLDPDQALDSRRPGRH